MKIRNRLQPTVEYEADEGEYQVLEHQGLIWSGTPEELAALYEAAGLPVPAPAGAPSSSKPSVAPSAPATDTIPKEAKA